MTERAAVDIVDGSVKVSKRFLFSSACELLGAATSQTTVFGRAERHHAVQEDLPGGAAGDGSGADSGIGYRWEAEYDDQTLPKE